MKTIKRILGILFCILALSLIQSTANAQVTVGIGVRVHVVPPPLPVYEQPVCPEDGYLWVPGYWAWNGVDYYWVPGEWIEPPIYGYLWTPCYWGFSNGFYVFHRGYWGRNVGFYGGVNYGYGYYGSGFYGGRWSGNHFQYNTAVMNVNRSRVHNVYADPSVNRYRSNNRTSFNGPGGVRAKPSSYEQAAMRERHIQATSLQSNHQQQASKNRAQFVSVNKGHPSNTAVSRVSGKGFKSHGAANNSQPHHEVLNRNHNQPPSMNKGEEHGMRPNGQAKQRPVRNEMNMQHAQSSPRQQVPQHQQHQMQAPQQAPHPEPRENNKEHER